MKTQKFIAAVLLLLLVASMQQIKAQAVRSVSWTHDCSIDPIYVWGLDELIVDGLIEYELIMLFNNDDTFKKLHFQNHGTILTGESGTKYKYIDLVAQGGGYSWPSPDFQGEAHFVGQLRVIALGTGVVYTLRVDIIIQIDKDGNVVIKKYIVE